MDQHINTDSLQVQTGYEDSSHTTTYCVSPQYADVFELWSSSSYSGVSAQNTDVYDLWSLPSCSDLLEDNICVDLGTTENNFIDCRPNCLFHPCYNPSSSDSQLPPNDIIPRTDSLLQLKQFKNSTILSLNSGSAFVDWKSYRPHVSSLQPRKSQSLHKRCISFLNCINYHKISKFLNNDGGDPGISIDSKTDDKVSIHHVAAERKRREKMREAFSALRALLPNYPEVVQKSNLVVLLQTLKYINHLKLQIEELEKKNAKLEALHHDKSLLLHENH